MSILGTITSFVSGIFKPAADLVDNLHTSDKEKGEIEIQKQNLRNEIDKIKFQLQERFLNYESQLMENRTKLIEAETKTGNIFVSSWRPALMVIFALLIVAKWLGFSAPGISEAVELELFSIVKLGMTGYVVGRSAEKVMNSYKEGK